MVCFVLHVGYLSTCVSRGCIYSACFNSQWRVFPVVSLLLPLHARSESCTMNDQAVRSWLRYPRAGEGLAFLFIQGFYSTFVSQLSLFTEPNLCHDFARLYAELGAWVDTPGFFLYNLNDFGRFGCIACRIVFLFFRRAS
jgi:hypothetical protein